MANFTSPGPTVRQVSAVNVQWEPILAVLTKRTYKIAATGKCAPHDEAIPFFDTTIQDPENESLLLHDFELFAYKQATDVVIQGHAYSLPPQRTFDVTVKVGKAQKTIRVIGERRCLRSAAGKLTFSDPAPIGKVPLRYSHAYGGRDAIAEAKHGIPAAELQPFMDEPIDLANASPYLYPRNPAGRGYLIEATPEAVEQLKLPNLEDPLDLLTPDRLVVGATGRWPTMPLPQATDWMDYDYFPRVALTGVVPNHDPLDRPIAEVARGYVPADILKEKALPESLSWQLSNGASLGLQVPYLTGNEAIELTNMHASVPVWRFTLPGDRPKIWTDGRKGKMNATQPVIHSVVIEPDKALVSIVWCGSAPALRKYLPDELAKMPLSVEW